MTGMHMDGQQLVALGIVAVAAVAVGRRLGAQIAGVRTPRRRPGKTAAGPRPAQPSSSPLIQVQLKPPAHMKRPPPDGS